MANKMKAALPGRLNKFKKFPENRIALIILVNARRFSHLFSNYRKYAQWVGNQSFDSIVEQSTTFVASSVDRSLHGFFSPVKMSVHLDAALNATYPTAIIQRVIKILFRIDHSLVITYKNNCFKVANQLLGSMPSRLNLSRHASLTHELKFPWPAASSICFKRSSSKRIFFFVLPERSKADLVFLSCIGTYRYCKLKFNGTYRKIFAQPLNATKPRSGGTLSGPLTPNDRMSIEAAMKNHITPPPGRNSRTPNKFTWRFLALDASTRNVIHIVATTEREARNQSPAGCVMVFAGRLPVQEAHYA